MSMRAIRVLLPIAAGGLAIIAAQSPPKVVRVPAIDTGLMLLETRREQQIEQLRSSPAFHDFQFQDRVIDSGIRFRHSIVDDAGKFDRSSHYDHGSGITAADVDGDGLIDLYFVNQKGGNQLWKSAGRGRFVDVTARSGAGLADRICVAASFADIDNDGDPDLFVTTVRAGNVLFENDGNGRFADISRRAGVDYAGHSAGATFVDYDLDGLLDLFVANVGVFTSNERHPDGHFVALADAFSGHLFPKRTEPSILYRNLGGGRFRDVSREVGLATDTWSGDATFADFNGDAFPDLYLLNMQGDDRYFENRSGRLFVDRTAEHFPRTPWGTMGVKVFDYDNDSRLDLLLTDMHSDMSISVGPDREKLKSNMQWTDAFLMDGANNIFGNALFRNLGDGRFREISEAAGVETYWPWGPSVGDLNADSYDDVFVAAGMNYPFRYGVNSVLLNERGVRFVDAEFVLGIEPRRDGRTATRWFELDCDGGDRQHERCESERGRVIVMSSRGTRSSVVVDLDNDGDLDIVTNEFNAEPQVLFSDLAARRSITFLKLQLTGARSNRQGIGALVTVRSGDASFTKLNDGKSGYLSQSALPLYFGLDGRRRIDRIDVAWPSGRRQSVSHVPLNRTTQLVEPR